MVKVTMAEVTLLEFMVVVMVMFLVMSNSCRPEGLPTGKVALERYKIQCTAIDDRSWSI